MQATQVLMEEVRGPSITYRHRENGNRWSKKTTFAFKVSITIPPDRQDVLPISVYSKALEIAADSAIHMRLHGHAYESFEVELLNIRSGLSRAILFVAHSVDREHWSLTDPSVGNPTRTYELNELIEQTAPAYHHNFSTCVVRVSGHSVETVRNTSQFMI